MQTTQYLEIIDEPSAGMALKESTIRRCNADSEWPVLEIVEARPLIAELTLGLGEVVFDYLARPEANMR